MGIAAGALAIGQLAFSAIGAFAQAQAASAQGSAERDAAQRKFDLEQEELTRQQAEINAQSREDKGDVIRRTEAELSTIRAQAGDIGLGGTSMVRLLVEQGAIEGRDLSRLEQNRTEQIENRQSQKRVSGQGYANTVTASRQREHERRTGAILGGIKSGLQIAGSNKDAIAAAFT